MVATRLQVPVDILGVVTEVGELASRKRKDNGAGGDEAGAHPGGQEVSSLYCGGQELSSLWWTSGELTVV